MRQARPWSGRRHYYEAWSALDPYCRFCGQITSDLHDRPWTAHRVAVLVGEGVFTALAAFAFILLLLLATWRS